MAHLICDNQFPEFFEFMMSLGDPMRGPSRKRVRLYIQSGGRGSVLRLLECWVNEAKRPTHKEGPWVFESDVCPRWLDGGPSSWPYRSCRLICDFRAYRNGRDERGTVEFPDETLHPASPPAPALRSYLIDFIEGSGLRPDPDPVFFKAEGDVAALDEACAQLEIKPPLTKAKFLRRDGRRVMGPDGQIFPPPRTRR